MKSLIDGFATLYTRKKVHVNIRVRLHCFFEDFYLGTAVASARTHTHATYYTRTPHSHLMRISRPITTHRYEITYRPFGDHVLRSGSVGDGRVTILLLVHAFKATYLFLFLEICSGETRTQSHRLERSWARSDLPLPTTGLSARSLRLHC